MRPLKENELRELQLSEFGILLEFREICEKYGLKYFLTAGTLLGAVRHGGFIPWDDDIDVAMPREDYDRLSEICKTELPAGLFFQNSKTDRNYPYFFSKIRRNGTDVFEPCLERIDIHKGQYIDIFPLDTCPKGDWAGKLYFKTVEELTCAYIRKVDDSYRCGYKKWYMRLIFRAIEVLPLCWIRFLREAVIRLPSKRSGKLCTVGGAHGYPAETYQAAWFDRAEDMQFESACFPAPAEWDAVLRNMYGEYMPPPDPADRAGHFLTKE